MRCTDLITYRDNRLTWSPDGTAITYAAEDSILTLNASVLDEPPTSLKPGGVPIYRNIAWSPDGSSLAYIVSRDGVPGIYVLDLEMNASRWLADGLNPTWSPDGTQVAYHTAYDERLMTIPTGGGTPIHIAHGFDADWSPDGEWLVFVSGDPASVVTEIVIRHMDSRREITLVSDGGANFGPRWRPR
jgi:TolB protein